MRWIRVIGIGIIKGQVQVVPLNQVVPPNLSNLHFHLNSLYLHHLMVRHQRLRSLLSQLVLGVQIKIIGETMPTVIGLLSKEEIMGIKILMEIGMHPHPLIIGVTSNNHHHQIISGALHNLPMLITIQIRGINNNNNTGKIINPHKVQFLLQM